MCVGSPLTGSTVTGDILRKVNDYGSILASNNRALSRFLETDLTYQLDSTLVGISILSIKGSSRKHARFKYICVLKLTCHNFLIDPSRY